MEGTLIVQKGGYLSLSTSQQFPQSVERYQKVKQASYQRLPQFLQDVLNQLDVMVNSAGPCIILKGSSGSGKTTILRALAEAYGKQDGSGMVSLHLGEQVDSKMLLGTYTSTKVPGEFVWLPGVLTKALHDGQWVLLEDIQSAPSEVVTLLLTLVKSGKLMIPGYSRPLQAADGFKLLLTWRVTEDAPVSYSHASSILSVLEQHCAVVNLKSMGSSDIQQVLCGRYPELDALSEQLATISLSRNIHIRHILKFCSRVSTQLYDGRITSVEDYMLEAIDCFCGGVPLEKRVAVACEMSSICGGISKEKVEQLCVSHKPAVHISLTAVAVGRAHLHRNTPEEPKFCFAHTQSSLCLLERVGRCVQLNEPVLLVGETGVGKTAAVNYLANITGNKLIVINVSQQTDSSDLLGGFKPVQTSQLVAPYRERFERLFHGTFSIKQNAQYLASVQAAFTKQQWTKLFRLMVHSVAAAIARLKAKSDVASCRLHGEWKDLAENIKTFKTEMRKPQAVFSFSFVEGALVEAVAHGWWILLDEINLATPEVLQCLSSLLEGPSGSFLLPEKAESVPVERHGNFRLFCCMNPATDIGKKSLPHSIRNRFTEFFVDEFQSSSDLRLIVLSYLKDLSPPPPLVDGTIQLYRTMKEYAENRLNDGTGRKPHYSMRSLCRALHYAARCLCGSLQRSLYEGLCMSFLSELGQDYHSLVMATIQKTLNLPSNSVTAAISSRPSHAGYVSVEGFWLSCGTEPTRVATNYVLVNSVKKNLKNLARVVSARNYPVLLQGPTSAGKTSLVQYLATITGHKCLRINNHEHTDLQEYVGMYTANSKGQLVFQEGVLVNAMRNGYWIILDELNLAPTEVLEALNRVLDDNRELFIPETQQLVKAHPEFLVFGTQNPPGTYGGRKVLSRAFRNRFIELHFEDIPPEEVVTILQERCFMPPSYAKRMVSVMKELQQRRSISGIFSGKYGLITMRDLFRWAERYRRSETKDKFHDWEQQLAEDGFMLLGGRLRESQEQQIILEVLQKHFKRSVDPVKLFGQDGGPGSLATRDTLKMLRQTLPEKFTHLVWTDELLKNAVLLCRAVQFDEPVLLVGNTGCGKTTLCHLLSVLLHQRFFSINCHMHTEAADFLGGLGPIRNRGNKEGELGLFEWRDGVVVHAMREGGVLLIDEISLADDAVLERLNSVLEPERKLLVSERSRMVDGEVYEITAQEGFVFLGTMNPGGDYGKKELSPALRNRFVEIWCTSASSQESYRKIIKHNLKEEFACSGTSWSGLMLDVIEWLKQSSRVQVSVRDILAWVNFMNVTSASLSPHESFYHGAHLVFLDGLGCGGSGGERSLREHALTFLNQLLEQHTPPHLNNNTTMVTSSSLVPETQNGTYGIAPFFIPTGPYECSPLPKYSLTVPGPSQNAFKLLRAMQLGKPLLIEGVPGVGKTTLVTALARASGHHVVRINLSEQSDISDLFGSDLPVEGGKGGQFAWRDGPCLTALKNGDWILLDEMNLASQSVLEGLNACLDHRGEIYIPELGMTFKVQRDTRFFACQNPLQQGGGRKGLPKSFTNRFTQVYIDALSQQDLLYIAASLYPSFGYDMLERMITFSSKVYDLVRKECGDVLWEFNLRDVLRWCELMQKYQPLEYLRPEQYVELVYCCRLRDSALRTKVLHVFDEVFETASEDSSYSPPSRLGSYFHVTRDTVQIGSVVVNKGFHLEDSDSNGHLLLMHSQMSTMEALIYCVDMAWMSILVGGSCCGKSSVVRCLAQLTGNKLVEFPMNTDTDTTELLGGFEQVNVSRQYSNLASLCHDMVVWLLHVITREASSTVTCSNHEETLKKVATNLSAEFSLQGSNNAEVNRRCRELIDVVKQLRVISETLQKPLPYDTDDILAEVESLSARSMSSDSCGQFEWVDSVLVKALRHGHWLLISHANFCSPSVLDRLNPLLEPGGFLSIDERGAINGSVPVVHPHPNFRLFLTMDHAHGEISRAMRNRGIEICMLPEHSLSSATNCRRDWLSLVTICGVDDIETASQIVGMCQVVPDLSPSKLVHIANSYHQLKKEAGDHPADILSTLATTYHLHNVMEVSEFCEKDVMYATTVEKYFLESPQSIVQRDVIPLLQAFNSSIVTGCGEGAVVYNVEMLASALEVFVSSATFEDADMRMSGLEQLAQLLCDCATRPCSVLVRLWQQTLAAINAYAAPAQWRQQLQIEGLCLNQVLPSTNPRMTIASSGLKAAALLLELFVKIVALEKTVEEHVQTVCVNGTKSLLQASCAVHKGVLPLEYLLHPSTTYLYICVTKLLELQKQAISGSNSLDSGSVKMLLRSSEWMSVLVEICMSPSCSLSAVACAWMLFKTHGLPAIEHCLRYQEKEMFQQVLTKFQSLESVLHVSRFYVSLKKVVGCPDVPSAKRLKHKSALEKRDLALRSNLKPSEPLSLLTSEAFDERRKLLECKDSGQQSSSPCEAAVNGVSERPSCLELANTTMLNGALQPAVLCLKRLLVHSTSGEPGTFVTQLNSLLDYCTQMYFVGIEPLLRCREVAAHAEGEVPSLQSISPTLVEYSLSGFGAYHCERRVSQPPAHSMAAVKSACSELCFSLLAPQSTAVEGESLYLHKRPNLFTIGGYHQKIAELKTLLKFLWLNGCSLLFDPLEHLFVEYRQLHTLFITTLSAISTAVQSCTNDAKICEHVSVSNTTTAATIREVRAAAREVVNENNLWERVEENLLHAQEELTEAQKLLSEDGVVRRKEYNEERILCVLNSARVHIGVALGLLLCPSYVDPVAVAGDKHHCVETLVNKSNLLVDAWDSHYHSMVGAHLGDIVTQVDVAVSSPEPPGVAPHVYALLQRRKVYQELSESTPHAAVSRVNGQKYQALTRTCGDLMCTLCAPEKVETLLQDLLATNDSNLPITVKRQLAWSRAVSASVQKLKDDYAEYPDIVQPFAMALTQMLHGVSSITAFKSCENRSLVEAATVVTQFQRCDCSYLEYLSSLLLLIRNGVEDLEDEESCSFKKRVIQVALEAAGTCLSSYPVLRPSVVSVIKELLHHCWLLWTKAEETAKRNALEEESLYRYRAKTHLIANSEVSEEEAQLNAMFPSYEEFSDPDGDHGYGSGDREGVAAAAMDEGGGGRSETDGEENIEFAASEMEQIVNIHSLLVSRADTSSPFSTSLVSKSFIKSSYELASKLVAKAGNNLPGIHYDHMLMGAHIRMCSGLLSSARKSATSNVNVYKDALISESCKVLPILSELMERVQELLMEWPDHPTLNQVLSACEKVLVLDVHEPLMKTLSGLEFVLKKAQDWEAYASSSVSLLSFLEPLTGLVLDWRKIELNSWKRLLSVYSNEVKTNASKWWFHLYALCKEYSDKSDVSAAVDEFISALQKFMESSVVGEFETRLEIVELFHREFVKTGAQSVSDILGNVAIFYRQFFCSVEKLIKDLTAPVDKEFNEYLTILRWNDGNYWAVKASAEKSHRALLKLVNKYKAVLHQPVRPLLSDSSLSHEQNDEGESSILQSLLQKLKGVSYLVDAIVEAQESPLVIEGPGVVLTAPAAVLRMRSIVRHFTTSGDVCFQWCESLNELTGDVQETSHYLQSVEFLKGVAEDKRRAAIKLNGLQKRKSLSDLFKTLKQQGLSYRKGAEFCEDIQSVAMKLPCIDTPDQLTSTVHLWEASQHSYYQCIARMAGLQSAFANPSKELTVSQVARCKGYAQYLMTLVCEERSVLATAFGSLVELRRCSSFLEKLKTCALRTVAIEDYKHWQSTLCTCLEQSLQLVSNFHALVDSMPEEELDFSVTPLTTNMLPPLTRCGDRSVAESALATFEAHSSKLEQLYVTSVCIEESKFESYATMLEVAELKEGYKALSDFVESTAQVVPLTMEGSKSVGLFAFLDTVGENLKENCLQFSEWVSSVESSQSTGDNGSDSAYQQEREGDHTDCHGDSTQCKSVMTELARTILLSVQKVMVHHDTNYKRFSKDDGDESGVCKAMHTTGLENLKDMRVEMVVEKIREVMALISQEDPSKESQDLLEAVLPLLEQYEKLYLKLVADLIATHCVLCKLLLALLVMFNTLAQKGFCTPPEETEEESQGTDFVGQEAGGFDEGEGLQNVSSQAEPNNLDPGSKQDAQDETKDEGSQEKKEEDDDAVEMSEDFGGKLEDVDDSKDDQNSSEESEGEEDTSDLEMGKLESDQADQLDRNMWAPEDEDKKEEEELGEQEESGGGMSLNEETKMVAKDDVESEQPPGTPKPTDVDSADEDSGIPDDTETSEAIPGEEDKEEDTADEADFGDLSLDDGEDEQGEERSAGDSEEDEEGGSEAGEPSQPMEEEDAMEDKSEKDTNEDNENLNALWAAEQTSLGVDPSSVNPAESEQSNASATGTQEVSEGSSSDAASVPLSCGATGTAATTSVIEQQREEHVPHRRSMRHENRSLADSEEESAIKRPRLMKSQSDSDPLQNKPWNEDHRSYQHVGRDSRHDTVVWDTADVEEALSAQHTHHQEEEREETEEKMEAQEEEQEDSSELASGSISMSDHLPHSNQDVMEDDKTTIGQEDMETDDAKNAVVALQSLENYTDTFFSSGSFQHLEQTQTEPVLRDDLKSAVSVLRSMEEEDQDITSSQLWIKYEMLVSSLSQMLSEELRLILLPTKATQLKGDFRTGKRLNMRRIIPYFASNFQNDRIWLRRTKPSKREYQILIAIDDSSSMNENNCNQMAYESLALISTALSRLDSGQLGVCRFGEAVEILHPLGQPFTASSGGFILKEMTFTQTKTNFIHLLEATQSIFAKSQNRFSTSSVSLEINQLLVILSDGRGVFADGSLPMEIAIRNLNQMGVFTVFIILDSLSKDSIVDIKVPTFIPGKPPIIKAYLDTFPFSFYVVLRDISKMPVVLGQALRQWFELISSQ